MSTREPVVKRRDGRVSLMAAAFAAVLVGAPPPAVAAPGGVACPLKVLAHATRHGGLLIVDRTRGTGAELRHTYLGCPAGFSYVLRAVEIKASRPGGRLRFGATGGANILVTDARTGVATVWNLVLRTHRTIRYAGRSPARVVVGEDGSVVAAFRGRGGTSIVAYPSYGARTIILAHGAIAATSLRRAGMLVSWRAGARTATADLGNLPLSCADLAGDEDARAPAGMRIVTSAYIGGRGGSFIEDRQTTRACLTGGPVRVLGVLLRSGVMGERFGYRVDEAAGTFVLGTTGPQDSVFGDPSLTDLATGAHHLMSVPGMSADTAVLLPSGQVAVAFSSGTGAALMGYDTGGVAHALDTGVQIRDLKLSGTTITWVTDGVPHSVDLTSIG